MTERVVIVGGGHNGLVCAAYLARAGRKVTVLEAGKQVGGAAVTREFAPGFRVSACAHLLYALDHVVAQELRLANHGLSYAQTRVRTVALSPSGPPLVIDGGQVVSASTLAGEGASPFIVSGAISDADRAALGRFTDRMARFAALLARQHRRVPPRLASGNWSDVLQAATLALDLRRLGREDMRELLRIAPMNVFDVLAETFESPLLKGALAMDAVLGTKLGPRSGHTVLNLLHRWSGAPVSSSDTYSKLGRSQSGLVASRGTAAIPRGGLGAVTAALAAAAAAAGAGIRVSSPVAQILLDGDRAIGVKLESGADLPADVVISNADPKQTFMRLVGARNLDTEFARRVHHLRTQGTAAKLHLALKALPKFRNVDESLLGERLLIAPDLDAIESAFNPAKYKLASDRPVLEITIPSIHDATLAHDGQHVLSAIVQYAPYDIEGGWQTQREPFGERVLDVLEHYAPGLRRQIVSAELLTPLDIEREFRITGGHWHHGELTLDQYLMLRPVPGAAQYATPIRNLYLCGAGSHPGGGVMGSAGYNAAHVVLRATGIDA
jgi:phytoene dehydrogenase-like protein